MAKKRKQQGHYCRICGEYKANEKFSGKGHARHICKECQSLPEEVKADMVRCNEVERAAFKYPMTRQDWELLEKYASARTVFPTPGSSQSKTPRGSLNPLPENSSYAFINLQISKSSFFSLA